MKTKNFKIIQAIYESGMTNSDLVREANLSSEARLSRIIGNKVMPTNVEIDAICIVLEKTPKSLDLRETELDHDAY